MLAEATIVKCQIVFELLSWEIFVGRLEALSDNGHRRLSAAETLSLLLDRFRIPNTIPASEKALASYASRQKKKSSAAQAICQIRNAILHSTEKKRRPEVAAPWAARAEADRVALGLVELLVIAIAGYNGRYMSRFLPGPRNVPWRQLPETTKPQPPSFEAGVE